MAISPRFPLIAAGLFGATGVGLGAFGAHALRTALTEMGTRDRWETAVFYQMVHVVALFGAAVWLRQGAGNSGRLVAWAVRCWVAGIALFSGGLYVLSLTTAAPMWFRIAVPPLGGTLFLLGWLSIALAGMTEGGPPGEK